MVDCSYLKKDGYHEWVYLLPVERVNGEVRSWIYLFTSTTPADTIPKTDKPFFGYKILKELLLGIDLYCLLCQHDFLYRPNSPDQRSGLAKEQLTVKSGHSGNHPPFTMIVVSNQLFVFFHCYSGWLTETQSASASGKDCIPSGHLIRLFLSNIIQSKSKWVGGRKSERSRRRTLTFGANELLPTCVELNPLDRDTGQAVAVYVFIYLCLSAAQLTCTDTDVGQPFIRSIDTDPIHGWLIACGWPIIIVIIFLSIADSSSVCACLFGHGLKCQLVKHHNDTSECNTLLL